jgi:hypothetical protein
VSRRIAYPAVTKGPSTLAGDTLDVTNPLYDAAYEWACGKTETTEPHHLLKFEFQLGDLSDQGSPTMVNHEGLDYITLDIVENLIGGDLTWQAFADSTNDKYDACATNAWILKKKRMKAQHRLIMTQTQG